VTPAVTEARPPSAVVAVLNPINRVALRTPFGRVIKPVALLEFEGRRTGRRLRVPVLWHPVRDGGYVFSPATWPPNFAHGALATVTHRGRRREVHGTLVRDPQLVADAFNELLAAGTKSNHTGLHIAPDHEVTADDVVNVNRALIRFVPA
jgi:hypothetical protein